MQSIETEEVTAAIAEENASSDENFPASADPNSKAQSEMQTSARDFAGSTLDNWPPCNELQGIGERERSEKDDEKRGHAVRMELLVRWLRFNFVGGIGIVVQFVALFLLKSGMHLDYLFATALAVEAAVVHNFVWHEHYTWADRVRGRKDAPGQQGASGAKAKNLWATLFAALKRCATLKTQRSLVRALAAAKRFAGEKQLGPSFRRFLRFNLTTGGVSIVGNVALMKVMVGVGHMNYLAANGIAIALCSLANFLVSEEWVYEGRSR